MCAADQLRWAAPGVLDPILVAHNHSRLTQLGGGVGDPAPHLPPAPPPLYWEAVRKGEKNPLLISQGFPGFSQVPRLPVLSFYQF